MLLVIYLLFPVTIMMLDYGVASEPKDDMRTVFAFENESDSRHWPATNDGVRPYMDERVRALAQSGVERLAVLSPSFVADCLETIEEIGLRAAEDFVKHGGQELRLVPSLNSEDVWVRAVARILQEAGLEQCETAAP